MFLIELQIFRTHNLTLKNDFQVLLFYCLSVFSIKCEICPHGSFAFTH